MAERGRTARGCRRLLSGAAAVAAVSLSAGAPGAARADTLREQASALVAQLGPHQMLAAAFTCGVSLFAILLAMQYLRLHRRTLRERAATRAQLATLRAETDRIRTLLQLDRQVIAVWGGGADPEIAGDIEIVGAAQPLRVLAFGAWLGAERAGALETAVERLRERGEAFTMMLATHAGRHIEAEGRAIGGCAVLRLREATGARGEAADLAERLRRAERDATILRSLVESLQVPMWVRDATGRLTWANAAYAAAVDAGTAEAAVGRNIELLDRADRQAAAQACAKHGRFEKRLAAIVAGERRQLDVVEIVNRSGVGAGIALDATEAEQVRSGLQQTITAHRRILDSLATGVAIFDASKRLVFYNPAYQRLFGLDRAFLDEHPADADVLDRLRAERKLPEQADFRKWRDNFLTAYHAIEPQEQGWHLPGGRMLRVVTNPSPDGGLTYLFDDITERIDLQSRINQLSGLHRETLDNLAEAVAVFGSDGRLKLHNPSFTRLWRLSPDSLAARPHIEVIAAWCQAMCNENVWSVLRATVTAIGGRHEPVARRIERADGSVLDATAAKLPDGSTLVTFRDVTDSVSVERVLTEKNEALEQADALKTRFIHHVSYELRTPLTNIIGFAQLLGDPAIGPLNAKQHDYVGHITGSSAALLAIIDDILDLATIDAGAMTIEPSEIDIRETMRAASEGVQDRIAEKGLKLVLDLPHGVGTMQADGRRVRQVLYNLLSNAVGFSPQGGTVALSVRIEADAVVFRVADEGPGIPEELKDKVFERFESYANGDSQHRGAGLGLSIVRSLVALHGGEVRIESAPGRGTAVTVRFPVKHAMAAE
ncbi:PAS domain-containing protein [Blastochloris sulfoviridis]|uniref:histidine kinase n=1 Tax=Blastochloris sulfoviridis TaxID=50712 RepID=A0A5M6HX06_9HYPH|nr:PAS domain-containing protein [Blastochloris sulfoviridis]